MTNYFYYFDIDGVGQKQGPVDEQLLKVLVSHGAIVPNTLMETEDGYQCMARTIPGLFGPVSPPSIGTMAMPPAQLSQPTSEQTIKILNSSFHQLGISTLICFMIISMQLALLLVFIIKGQGDEDFMAFLAMAVQLLGLFGCIFLLVAIICMFVLLYQLWKQIPASIASTTPGKAVGLLFLPIFNLYWIYIAFRMLSVDMNKALQLRGILHRVSEGRGMSLCVLCWACLIPGVALLVMLPAMIVMIFFFKSVKDGAIILLKS